MTDSSRGSIFAFSSSQFPTQSFSPQQLATGHLSVDAIQKLIEQEYPDFAHFPLEEQKIFVQGMLDSIRDSETVSTQPSPFDSKKTHNYLPLKSYLKSMSGGSTMTFQVSAEGRIGVASGAGAGGFQVEHKDGKYIFTASGSFEAGVEAKLKAKLGGTGIAAELGLRGKLGAAYSYEVDSLDEANQLGYSLLEVYGGRVFAPGTAEITTQKVSRDLPIIPDQNDLKRLDYSLKSVQLSAGLRAKADVQAGLSDSSALFAGAEVSAEVSATADFVDKTLTDTVTYSASLNGGYKDGDDRIGGAITVNLADSKNFKLLHSVTKDGVLMDLVSLQNQISKGELSPLPASTTLSLSGRFDVTGLPEKYRTMIRKIVPGAGLGGLTELTVSIGALDNDVPHLKSALKQYATDFDLAAFLESIDPSGTKLRFESKTCTKSGGKFEADFKAASVEGEYSATACTQYASHDF